MPKWLVTWLNSGPLYDLAVAAAIVHALVVTAVMIWRFNAWDAGTMSAAWGAVTATMGAHFAGDKWGRNGGGQ